MSKYYTKEEKAEVKGGGKKKEEDSKSKESKISALAEAQENPSNASKLLGSDQSRLQTDEGSCISHKS